MLSDMTSGRPAGVRPSRT